MNDRRVSVVSRRRLLHVGAAAVVFTAAGIPALPADVRQPAHAGPRPSAQASRAALAGHWVRNDERSDASYWMREYPGMTLEVGVDGDRVDVRQSLGSVRDGVAQPGSGSEFREYTLIVDGHPHELVGPGAARRTATAEWQGESLHVDSVWHLSQGDEAVEIAMTETWTVTDAGARLEIHREAELPSGKSVSTNVFDRR